jgi:hypothetical protein
MCMWQKFKWLLIRAMTSSTSFSWCLINTVYVLRKPLILTLTGLPNCDQVSWALSSSLKRDHPPSAPHNNSWAHDGMIIIPAVRLHTFFRTDWQVFVSIGISSSSWNKKFQTKDLGPRKMYNIFFIKDKLHPRETEKESVRGKRVIPLSLFKS